MLSKTKTIAITAYRRPQYFERLISSLIKNDLHDWEIYIQLEPSKYIHDFFEIAERLLKPYNYFIAVNSSVLGVQHNPYSMLDKIFVSDSFCCIYLEEDLIVSPDIIKLAEWYLNQDHTNIVALNFIMGGCASAGFISNSSEPTCLVKTKTINSLGLVFTSEQWAQHIKINWLRAPEHAITWNKDSFTGWDLALYDYVLSNSELYVLQPICSRVMHIGEKDATHVTSDFQKQAFAGLEIYEGSHVLDYKICSDFDSIPYYIKSHLNLWLELTAALVTLKEFKKSETQLNTQIKEANTTVDQLNVQREEANTTIVQLNVQIEEANITIDQLKVQIEEANTSIAQLNVQKEEANATIAQLNSQKEEANTTIAQLNAQREETNTTIVQLNLQIEKANTSIKQLLHSKSWRLTSPLRWFNFKLKSVFRI